MDNYSYKRDVVASTWLDSRDLATCVVFLVKKGVHLTSLSDAVATCVLSLADIIANSGEVAKVEFTTDARKLLEQMFKTSLNTDKRGMKNVIHNLQLDSMLSNKIDLSKAYETPISLMEGGMTEEEKLRIFIPQEMKDKAVKE